MPAGVGQISTLSDNVTTKRAIAAVIKNITPRDIPCVSYFGLDNGGKFGVQNLPNNRYEWLEDTLRVRTAVTITPAVSGTTGTINVTSGQGLLFRKGDVWQTPSGDLFWVSAMPVGDAIVGIPNWGALNGGAQGTWTATIAIGSTLTYKYSARIEGADSDPSPYTAISNPYNLSHIMQAEIRVTGSEQDATTRYGVSDSFQYQLEKWLGGKGAGNGQQGRAGDLMLDLENTFFSGARVARADNNTAGAMGGFPYFVVTNVNHNSGVARYLSQRILEDQLQQIWLSGGMPDCIICNAFQKRQINSFYTGSIRTDRSDKTGGAIINAVETDFGVIDIMLTRRADPNKIFIVQKDKVGWVSLRKFFVHDLAINGDYTRKEILGEYGFIVQNEQCHGIIKDLATV